MTTVSLEFFPPKTDEGLTKLIHTAKRLAEYNPAYVSVTFGAGGSTQDSTLKTVKALKDQTDLVIVPHLSCIGTTKAAVKQLLQSYQYIGISRLVILRGDLPSGFGGSAGDFHYATDLVRYIREIYGDYFHISVAVYPECHPMADSMQSDLTYFKQKVDAGANQAITQYFYSIDGYERLLEECACLDIDIPIVPGIMPITNYTQLARFSERCGAEIPRWIQKRLVGFGDDKKSIKQFGLEVVSRLCQQLIQLGAPDLHFYTLNKADPSIAIIKQLNLINGKKEHVETV